MILCLFSSLIFSISCSKRFDFHVGVLHEDCLMISTQEDSIKRMTFEREIIPWLKVNGGLSDEEISSINLEKLNRLVNPQLPPLFGDSKKLFQLLELLFDSGLVEMGSEVLKYVRSTIFISSTYKTLIESLSLDELTVFNQVLRLWFPNKVDLVSVIQHLVDLRMGEDTVLELIDVTWDEILTDSSNEFVYYSFSRILLSAMNGHYVSVFEDILERLPKLIKYINRKMMPESSIVHYFCNAIDPEALNKLKIMKRRITPNSALVSGENSPPNPGLSMENLYSEHRSRSYPSANKDLLSIMIRFGADINAYDSDRKTPLHLAIVYKNAHILRILLEAGADYAKTFHGQNISEFVADNYSSEVDDVLDYFLTGFRTRSHSTNK